MVRLDPVSGVISAPFSRGVMRYQRKTTGSQARWVGVFAIVVGLMFNGLVYLPATAAAQLSSGIAGAVEDTTGAVLPGVTVEANSPALIGGARVAVTDNQGQYRILELRPGAYTVTFTLPGFGTVVRDGIDLATNFTASVNIELTVGSIEESVTVSGAAPQVDVQKRRGYDAVFERAAQCGAEQ